MTTENGKPFLFDKIERLRRLKISPDDDVGRQGSGEVGKEGERRKKKKKDNIHQQGKRM